MTARVRPATPEDAEAAGFYESLGGQSEPMIVHALSGRGFETLADDA
jgi:hypothetical protein